MSLYSDRLRDSLAIIANARALHSASVYHRSMLVQEDHIKLNVESCDRLRKLVKKETKVIRKHRRSVAPMK